MDDYNQNHSHNRYTATTGGVKIDTIGVAKNKETNKKQTNTPTPQQPNKLYCIVLHFVIYFELIINHYLSVCMKV